MEITELEELLTRVAGRAEPEYSKARGDALKFGPDVSETFLEAKLAEPVAAALSKQIEFHNGTGFMIQEPDAAVGFHAQEAAVVMVRLVRGGRSPREALEWLERLLHLERATGLSVLALWGVSIDLPTALTESIRLVPFNAVPASPQMEWLTRPREVLDLHIVPFAFRKGPEAALVMNTSVEPVLIDAKRDLPGSFVYTGDLQTLDEARLALTAVGPSAPLYAAGWFQFDDPDLKAIGIHGGIRSMHHEIIPWGFDKAKSLDPHAAKEVVSGFFGLGKPVRDKVQLALQRLNQAMRRASHADKALELAIALEVLLTEGGGENTYKVGLRSALLGEGSQEERLRVRGLIGALYAVRSAVAHDGRLPEKVKRVGIGKVDAFRVVDESLQVVADLLRGTIRRGEIPDWYSFEIGS